MDTVIEKLSTLETLWRVTSSQSEIFKDNNEDEDYDFDVFNSRAKDTEVSP